MIPGVHATIAVDRRPEDVLAVLDRKGWPWLGRRGPLGSREIRLDGNPFREFRLRVFAAHHAVSRGPTWRVVLEQSEDASPPHSVLELELSVTPLGGDSSRLSIGGMFSSTLFRGREGAVGQSVTRRVANEHARSLLEQVATILEEGAHRDKRVKPDASLPSSASNGRLRAGGPRAVRTRRP
jgi:hypothetical protein